MGWGKDMLFLGGYLSPAALAEEIRLERAAEAAAAAQRESAARAIPPATGLATPAGRAARAAPAPARSCA